MKKKFIFIPSGHSDWLDLCACLHEHHGWTLGLWFGEDTILDQAKARFPHLLAMELTPTFHGLVDEQLNLPHGDRKSWLRNITPLELCTIEAQTIKMFDRQSISHKLDLNDRKLLFWKLFWGFKKTLDYVQPNAVICSEAPHQASTFLITKLCEINGIPVIVGERSILAPVIFFKLNADTTFLERKSKPCPPDINTTNIFLENFVTKFLEAFKNKNDGETQHLRVQTTLISAERNQTKLYSQIKSFLMPLHVAIYQWRKNLIPTEVNPNKFWHEFSWKIDASSKQSKFQSNISMFESAFRKFCGKARRWSAMKRIRRNAILSGEKIESGQFVYLPLHYEPEKTTNPDGGEYWDQYYFIEALINLVPKYIGIVLREHPAQQMLVRQGYQGRHPLFYDLLKKHDRLQLSDTSEKNFKLLDGCIAVATTTGTVVLESCLLGKRVIMGGRPWHSHCPGVSHIDDISTWDDFINSEPPNLKTTQKFLEHFHAKFGYRGVINPGSDEAFKDLANTKMDVKAISADLAIELENYQQVVTRKATN